MLGAEKAPRTDRAITATIGTGWEVRLAARHRGFAAIPRMMNPFARFDFVVGRRASGGHVRHLQQRLRVQGDRGVLHGLRGQRSNRKIFDTLLCFVLLLYMTLIY